VDIAHEAYRKIEYKSDVPLKMKETKLTLNCRVPDEKRLEWARKVLEGVKGRKVHRSRRFMRGGDFSAR